MSFKPIDPKRDEYRRYLERGGIIESLTKVFVRILEERPEDPTQYLLQNLGDARLQADNIAYLQSELEDARNEIQRLTRIIHGINPELLNEQSYNNDSINNDNSNANSEIKGDDATSPPVSDDQNRQPLGEYSTVVEGLKNTHILETNKQATDVKNVAQSEIVSNTE